MATAKQLDDITECPICTEVYTDPRVLPCVHTYCLKCIKAWSKDKYPGEELACPLCRKEFTLPSSGVGDLPKNFFVANYVQMKELSSAETRYCEACSGGGVAEKKVATFYCFECQQKLCQMCEEDHKKFRVTRRHKTVELGEMQTSLVALLPNTCDKHEDKFLEIYCFDCKWTLCMMCYIERHNSHKCSDVNKVVGEFRQQMGSDVDSMTAGIVKCREIMQNIEREKKHFCDKVTKTETEIIEKAEELKQMIDVHKEKLMNVLSSMKQKRMKEIESLREEIERQLLSMESFKKYVDEVRQKGTACDIARAASGLHDRADELLMFDVIERTLADLGHADVKFTSSDFDIDNLSNILGKLSLDLSEAGVIPSEFTDSVVAVTSLDDDVFVVRYNNEQIEVYDAVTLTLRRCLGLPGTLRGAGGLAACGSNHCVYVSDWNRSNVRRVELSVSNAMKKWSVADHPAGLSVNKANNLLVTCDDANKIQEYTTHGSLVREICLQADVALPWHAIQLSTGDYVVSQCTSPGVVSVVGVDGQVVHSYERSQTSDVGEMQYPSNIAVSKEDDIFVADEDNNRILSINISTGCVQELALPIDYEIKGPRGLCLDESRGRLYVGEFSGQCGVLLLAID